MSDGHPYPSRYRPGGHWALDRAWEMLDTLPVGTLDAEERAWLCGLISGALMRAAKDGPVASEMLARRELATGAKNGQITTEALARLPKLKPRRERQ